MKAATGPMPAWLKITVLIAGLLLLLAGLPLAVGYLCALPLLILHREPSALAFGLLGLVFVLGTLGAGGVASWHGLASLRGKRSRPLRLPPAWLMVGVFGLCTAAGLLVYQSKLVGGILFPPLLIAAAAVGPLLAISWFGQERTPGFSWRRGLLAFAAGATVSVALATVLEILFPSIILALILDLGKQAIERGQAALAALAGQDIATAIASPGFILVFVQIAVIAPLAEEAVKPLVVLPLIGRLGRREAFLAAAMAGAGFATLENILYAGLGLYFWAGTLIMRAVGSAIHPLGAGLVGLAWRDILRGERGAWASAARRLAAAVGMHAFWNGGSLLVITLAGARFFGELPPEVDILGISAGGTTLAFLIVLGLAALWLGRSIVQKAAPVETVETIEAQFELSDRALAIWALACLAAIVPAGIMGLRLLAR